MDKFQPNATLSSRRDVNNELVVVRVLPDPSVFGDVEPINGQVSFLPGQYAELAIIEDHSELADSKPNKLVRKAYSIASRPGDPEGLEFYIALVAEGTLTPKLWRLNPKDRLWLNPKIKGKFTLESVAPGKDLVLAATGTGIAPFISMLRAHCDDPPWRKVAIMHGVRYASDLGYHQELLQLSSKLDNVRYIPIVSREDDSLWSGERGRIQKLFEPSAFESATGFSLDPQQTQIMLCGNPDMIDNMDSLLQSCGHKPHKKREPGNIHFERYW